MLKLKLIYDSHKILLTQFGMEFSLNMILFMMIFMWVIFFLLAYQILRKVIKIPSKIAKNDDKGKKEREYSFHVLSHLSLFHAIVNLVLSISIALDRSIYYEESNQPDVLRLLCFSAGYYLSNSIIGYTHKFHPISMLFHHLIVLSEIIYAFWAGYYGNIVIYGFAIAEASNPFRIIKNISDGYEEGKRIGEISILIFSVLFLIFRSFKQIDSLSRAPILHSNKSNTLDPKNERCRTVFCNKGTLA